MDVSNIDATKKEKKTIFVHFKRYWTKKIILRSRNKIKGFGI